MIQVVAGAGYVHSNWLHFSKELQKREDFYCQAIESGIHFFDTATSYYSGAAEAALGRAIRRVSQKRSHLCVDTKIGGLFSHFPVPFNHLMTNSRVVQKLDILTGKNVNDFDSTINPLQVIKILKGSLHSLNLNQIDILYLHGLPPNSKYEDFLDQLHLAKQMGLCRKVGLSLATTTKWNIEKFDVLQVPFDLLENLRAFHGELVVNQFFSSHLKSKEHKIKALSMDSRVIKVVLGTRKIARLHEFQDLLKRM